MVRMGCGQSIDTHEDIPPPLKNLDRYRSTSQGLRVPSRTLTRVIVS